MRSTTAHRSIITATILALSCFLPNLQAETAEEKAARMEWFNDARFGMFVHWGVFSEAAGSWNGKPVTFYSEWIQNYANIPAADYREQLLPAFNPTQYNPEAWALAAKNAGMKYLVITTKHHDGFCLWDSKLTDWDIASTPYRKDLLKPLADACRKHGIRFCVYYSIMDWSHPDWGDKAPWRGNIHNSKPDMDRYTEYMKGQLTELIDAYQPGILWFDGEWENAWTHERGKDLYAWLRVKDPNLIINNRVDKGRAGNQGYTKDEKYMGDYGTPEQEIPTTGFGPGVSWESCMTMNDSWAYKSYDHNWKSTANLLQNLIDIASKGGNYLLNVGPTGAGVIPAPSLERLEQIGRWMKIHGESIHGTTASLFPKTSWNGRSTTKRMKDGGARVYIHVFQGPSDGLLTLRGLVEKPSAASLLGSSAPLAVGGSEGSWTIKLPEAIDPIAAVVALDFPATPTVSAPAAELDAGGVMKLDASAASAKGNTFRLVGEHIGFWTDANDHLVWKARLPAGTYQVEIDGSLITGPSAMRLTAGAASLEFKVEATGSWETYQNRGIGELKVEAPQTELLLRPLSKSADGFVNLRSLTLRKIP